MAYVSPACPARADSINYILSVISLTVYSYSLAFLRLSSIYRSSVST